jgi:epoxide hydrolase-like predicted phosphatase
MIEIQKSAVRNIIFDLGGVLLNINPLLSLIELEKISGIGKDELISRFASEHIFEKFDTGSLTPDQFRVELSRIINKNVNDAEIDRAWNILIQDFPSTRVELVQQLRKNYRVFLLSNTNSIHFEHYTAEFYEKNGFSMADLFERLFLSYEIGIHKPDAGIYSHVLENAHIDASETVFIDDSLANIKAAEELGISGIHIHDGYDVEDFFENGILRIS